MKKEIPLHIVGVSAFIPWRGRVLALQRADSERFLPRHWELPGGKIEHAEHPYDALRREVLEETGLAVEPLHPYTLAHDELPDGRHYVSISILCAFVERQPTVRLSADHQAFHWITEGEIPSLVPMSPMIRDHLIKGFALSP